MTTELTKGIPPIQPFKPNGKRMLGGTPHYGAIQVAANYCGVPYRNWMHHFCWHHGVMPPWQHFNPKAITYSLRREEQFFVARKDQEEYLRDAGYPRVRAIGLPILYADTPEVERLPDSLLIMPPHVLTNQEITDKSQFSAYVEFIRPYIAKFDHVCACINSICISKGYWINEFRELGVQIIEGASPRDANALLRQAYLYKRFETITTNSFGSHVAYALHFGAGVSIDGPETRLDLEQRMNDETWKGMKADVEKLFGENWLKADAIQKFRVPPNKAVKDEHYGSFLLGKENKLPPTELKKAFGWGNAYKRRLIREKMIAQWNHFTMTAALRTRIKKVMGGD